MTAEHWQECLQSESFRRYFWSSAPRQRYFTMLGSRLPIKQEPVRHPFKASRMQRDLLMITVEPPELPPLTFATSHLESMDEHKDRNAAARRVQIDESLSRLADYPDVVFCGDTNINEAVDGNVKLPAEWEDADAWLVLKPDDPGYTFDVERNRMMAASDGWARANNARLRFDRFWTKMTNYAATEIELLDEPIKDCQMITVLRASLDGGVAPESRPLAMLLFAQFGRVLPGPLQVGLLRALELVVVCARLLHEDLNGATSALASVEVQGSPARNGLELLLLRVLIAGLEFENDRCKRLREAEAEALKSEDEDDDDEPGEEKGGKFLSDFLDLEDLEDSDGSDAGGDTFQAVQGGLQRLGRIKFKVESKYTMQRQQLWLVNMGLLA
eukprot:s109_g29.t1